MQYICLIYSNEAIEPQPGTEEFVQYIQDYGDFTKRVQEDGVYVGGEALQPVATATTVSAIGGKVEVMDGPFAETKEQLGGYYVLDCENLDQAIAYAGMIPTAKHGRVEVRPIMVFDQ